MSHRSQLHACSTGQRLHCPDDPTCLYSTSDKSALLRHRQRKHGYRAKSTASKDRCMNVSKNRMSSSEKLDDPSEDDSPPSPLLKHSTDSCCPCCPSMVSDSSDQAYGADDETDIRQDDDHASPQAASGTTNQTVESIEWSLVEGHVTSESRFPVSFARTRLPHGQENGALSLSALKLCRCRTSNLQSTPVIALAHSNGTGSNPVSRTGAGVNWKQHATVDRSRLHLSKTGGALTSYSRVST